MENPPKDINLIETEEGLVLAKEVLDYPAMIDSIEDEDLKGRIIDTENITDPKNKILKLLELSKESRKKGYIELGSILNKHAIEIDNQNDEYFEKETSQRLQAVKDHIDNFRGYGNKNIENEEVDKEFITTEKKSEQIVVKKSSRNKLVSTLGRMFGF